MINSAIFRREGCLGSEEERQGGGRRSRQLEKRRTGSPGKGAFAVDWIVLERRVCWREGWCHGAVLARKRGPFNMELDCVQSNCCRSGRSKSHPCRRKRKLKGNDEGNEIFESPQIRSKPGYWWLPPRSRTMEPTKDFASPKSMSVLSR